MACSFPPFPPSKRFVHSDSAVDEIVAEVTHAPDQQQSVAALQQGVDKLKVLIQQREAELAELERQHAAAAKRQHAAAAKRQRRAQKIEAEAAAAAGMNWFLISTMEEAKACAHELHLPGSATPRRVRTEARRDNHHSRHFAAAAPAVVLAPVAPAAPAAPVPAAPAPPAAPVPAAPAPADFVPVCEDCCIEPGVHYTHWARTYTCGPKGCKGKLAC